MEKQLIDILNTMDVPVLRKELTLWNLLWLKRNLIVRNSNHEEFSIAIHFINHLITEKSGE
jgi:hypothetical protein